LNFFSCLLSEIFTFLSAISSACFLIFYSVSNTSSSFISMLPNYILLSKNIPPTPT
jgi:hypothetical protein